MLDFFTNPVFPITPSFIDNKLDCSSTLKYLEYLRINDVKTIMTTAGTSQFNLLTENEVSLLNGMCSEFKGKIILGLPISPLIRSIIEKLDAEENTAYLVIYPDRYYDDKTIISYFQDLAEFSNRPLLIHAMPIRSGFGMHQVNYTHTILKELSATPNIIGMKEECNTYDYAYELCEKVCENFGAIVAGGSIRRYNHLKSAGAHTYLAGLGSVFPKLEMEYWKTKDNKYLDLETKMFDVFMKIGWHKALRTALKLKGFIREDRQPFPQASKEEIYNIKNVMDELEKL